MELAQFRSTTAAATSVVLRAGDDSFNPVHVAPTQVLLQVPLGAGWRLLEPISLTVEKEWSGGQAQIVAYDSLFNVYGVGFTAEEALLEYWSMLVDLYEELEATQAVLSPSLQQQWRRLRSLIART